MKIIAVTQKGQNKSENEDRIVVGKSIIANGTFFSEMNEGIMAVADGVGGNNAGSVASHFVASRLCTLNEVSVEQLKTINDELLKMAKTNAGLEGMATTLAGICCFKNRTHLFSIGNTRVYLLQGRKYLKQLTTDDTTLNYLVSTGLLSSEDAKGYEKKNEITACFGGDNASLFKIRLDNIDSLLLPFMITSDGIHDYVSVDDMECIIEKDGLSEKTCEKLIKAARNNGSFDDASIVLGNF